MKVNILALLFGVITATSCSTQILKVKNSSLIETPKQKTTNLSKALQCARKAITSSEDRNYGYAYIVANIADGTVPNSGAIDGALSDTMQYELTSNLHYLTSGYGSVLANFPLIYQPVNGKAGLNSYGGANSKESKEMLKGHLEQINTIRSIARNYNPNEKISNYNRLTPLIIMGAFTRSDTSPLRRKNLGVSVGNSGTSEGDLSYGRTSGYKAHSLTILLNHPVNNTVTNSRTFTVYTHEADTSLHLNLGFGEGSVGLSSENLLVESPQGAQQALIDAASLWIAQKTFGAVANIDACLPIK